ncbi:MAG: hypothetical protein EP343_34495 [Deltaproteobacteria bacterium]|nr:MAG: hypothetical protein EP343_34495 [Deltaproteobacteria bacterium]
MRVKHISLATNLLFLGLGLLLHGHGEAWALAPLKLTQQDLKEGFQLKTKWQFKGPDGKQYVIPVPGSWEASAYKRRWTYFGVGVYRLQLEIPSSMVGQRLQLHSPLVLGSSLRVYVNGTLVGHNGSYIGSPSKVVQYYPFRATSTRLKIKVQIKNEIFHLSGLVYPIWIGTYSAIQKKRWRGRFGWHLILGIFIFLSVFHFLLFGFYRQDKIVLYFAFVCLFMAMRVEFFGAQALEYLFGDIPISINVKLARISLYGIAPALLWYVRSLTHDYFPRWLPQSLTYLGLFFSCTVFLPPAIQALFFQCWLVLILGNVSFGLFLMLRLWGRPEARFFVYSSLFFSLTIFNDILHGLGAITTGFYARFGFFLFCFSQAGYIAWRNQKTQIASVKFAKELEETNQNLEMLIDKRTQEIQEKNQQLQELMKFKEDSVKMLVHDLKSPLSTFLHVSEGVPQSGSSFQSASLRMQTLIESMLQVNESEQVKLALEKKPHLLHTLCQRAISVVSTMASVRDITISNEVPSTYEVEVDEMLLERVIQNVLDNALKFSPEGSQIDIRCSEQGEHYMLEILDEGPGVSPEVQAKAFDMHKSFGQGPLASSGLGLFFCQEAIHAHEGTIRLKNRVTGGTNVQIQLPRLLPNEEPSLPLSPVDTELLAPFVLELQSVEVYEISKLQHILKKLNALTRPSIEHWRKALQTAIKEVDEVRYQQLIHQVSTDLDHR